MAHRPQGGQGRIRAPEAPSTQQPGPPGCGQVLIEEDGLPPPPALLRQCPLTCSPLSEGIKEGDFLLWCQRSSDYSRVQPSLDLSSPPHPFWLPRLLRTRPPLVGPVPSCGQTSAPLCPNSLLSPWWAEAPVHLPEPPRWAGPRPQSKADLPAANGRHVAGYGSMCRMASSVTCDVPTPHSEGPVSCLQPAPRPHPLPSPLPHAPSGAPHLQSPEPVSVFSPRVESAGQRRS